MPADLRWHDLRRDQPSGQHRTLTVGALRRERGGRGRRIRGGHWASSFLLPLVVTADRSDGIKIVTRYTAPTTRLISRRAACPSSLYLEHSTS
jgi:hypothetical protein